MKIRKNNKIKILQQEAPIPEIVEQKMDDAFHTIQNGEISCTTETSHVSVHKRFVRKWSFAAVAVTVMCVITACAAAYTNWSRSLEGRLQITEGQKQMLEKNNAWSVLNQSVISEGVTVTARQCIVDNYCAYIVFKIEGYELPEGATPSVKRMEVTVGDNGSRRVDYYADFYREITYDKKGGMKKKGIEDEILLEDDHEGSFAMDDGGLEYQLRILTMEKGALLGKPIHVKLQGLGSQMGKSGPVYDNLGKWEFDWVLSGTVETAKAVLNEKLDDTEITIIGAEISPISVKFTFEQYGAGMRPRLFGYRTKDGKMHLNTVGAGISRYDYLRRRCTIINVATRIMDAEQIDALVFTDIDYKFIEDDPDMHIYTVPIAAFKLIEN